MIVALMYCKSDLEPTMQLARLLADIEPEPRQDVILALVRQPDVALDELTDRTSRHCARKFTVENVVSPLGAQGHPQGCTALWTGTCLHYYERFARGELDEHRGLLTLDGGDGIPLHRDWISLFKKEHDRTLGLHLRITGTPYFIDRCPLHVNPNALFDLRVFGQTRLLTPPVYDGTLETHFDIYHREEMLAQASLSSVVRTDWHGQGQPATHELLLNRSRRAIWLHGYKDDNLRWLCREHLRDLPAPPQICHYTLPEMRQRELLRRSYEEVNW